MGKIVSTKVQCGDDIHTISIWEPGSEDACGVEHVVYGKKGYIICFEDHEVELTLTTMDLGVSCSCLDVLNNHRQRIVELSEELLESDFGCLSKHETAKLIKERDFDVFLSLTIEPVSKKEIKTRHSNEFDEDAYDYIDAIENTAMRLADNGNLRLMSFIIKHGWKTGVDELCHAAENGHLNMVRFILEGFDKELHGTRISITKAKNRAIGANKTKITKYLTKVLEECKKIQEPTKENTF
ncbi:MAG: hypothetical protein WCV79_04265 [Candidatus Paceibacterota bacterium]|jgi:hypothetical protein